MRKFYVLILLLCSGWISVNAQSTVNYTVFAVTNSSLASDINSNAIDMSTGTTQLLGSGIDDTQSSLTNLNLGGGNTFEFYFMGTRYTNFGITDNGVMGLGVLPATGLYSIPSSTNAILAPFANDMRTGTDGRVEAKVFGTFPNRTLVVQWTNNMIRYATTAAAGTGTWQVRLYESSGVIEYVYGTMNTNAAAPTAYYVGFSSNTTANNILSINTTTTALNTTATPTQNTYTASSSVAPLTSAANGSRRSYRFVPPGNAGNLVATTLATPGAPLTFTGVGPTAMTLNWSAAAPTSGIVKYAIYLSTDGGSTYTYYNTTNLATTLAVTGLTPSTTYFWRVYSLSEGTLSASPIAASQATTAPATYYWVGASGGTWNTPANWNTLPNNTGSQRTTPTATDILIIDGAGTVAGAATTISVDVASFTVAQLKVTSNTAATLNSSITTTRTITLGGAAGDDFVIEAGSTLNLTNANNAVAFAFTGTGNTGDISGTYNASGSTSNVITTSGGTGTLVTVSATGVVNNSIPGSSGCLLGSAATLSFANGSNYTHSAFTTSNAYVPLATWGATSNIFITGGTTSGALSNPAQTFGNFTYNSATQTAATTNNYWTTGTTAVIQGNLNVIATGAGKFRATSTGSVTINNNLIITGGTFEVSGSTGVVNVLGNVSVTTGTLDIAQGGASILRIGGNLVQNSGTILQSNTGGLLEFNGTTSQSLTLINGSHGANAINARLNNAAGINLTSGFSIRNLTVSRGNITGAGSIAYATTSVLTYNSTTGNQTATAVEFPAASGPGSLTNNNASGLPNNVLSIPFSRALSGTAGILALTAGTIDNTGFVLSVPNTAVAAITGASATNYVKGALERNLAASLTGTLTYNFPVGKGTYNNLELVNPVTNAGGTVTVRAEAFDAATGGTAGANMTSLSTNRYWAASITAGSANFTSTLLRLSDVPGTANAIAASSTLTGAYDLVGGLSPTVGAGSILTTAPALTAIGNFYVMGVKGVAATYVSSTTTQAVVTPVVKPATNQQIIGVQIVTSGNLSPLTVANLSFSTNGSTNASLDISAARVFYTGTTNTFSTATQFGADVINPSGAFTVSGSQVLAEGTNYFWLVYDVPAGATLNNLLDAECTQIDYGVTQVPTVTAPTGTRIIKGPLHGTYLIGPSQVTPNYTKLTDALGELNLYGADAAVTFALASDYVSTSETFPLVIGAYPGNSSTNSLTIRPNTGVTATISASNSTAIFTFNGARYVTIDGSNTVGGTTRNLTIANTNTLGTTIRFINGAQFSGIKNSAITGVVTSLSSAVIYIGTASASSGNNNITIQNNAITKGASLPGTAILNLGTSAALANTNVLITGNSISDFSAIGVYDADFSSNLTVSNNLVFGTVTQTTSSDLYGIYLEGSNITLPVITGNKVYDLKSTNTNTSTGIVHGIDIYDMAAGTTCLVANNMVSLSGNGAGAPGVRVVGIADEPTSGTVNLYYNTVSITGTASSGSGSFAYLKNFTNTSNLRNNIFSNTRISSGTATQYAIAFSGGGTINSNYNDFYSNGNALNVLGTYNLTNQATLAAWQTASSGDANSVNVLPVFIAATDLHLNRAQNNGISNLGTPVAGITTDIDSDTRNATTPDMGADEFIACTPTPLATITTLPTPASICVGSNIQLTENGGTATSWLWSNGATTQTISVSPAATTNYSVTATVSTGCEATASQLVTVNALPAAVTVTPNAPVVCADGTVLLTATGGEVNTSVQFAFGTQANQNTAAVLASDYPAPYSMYYGGQKMQMLIRASELTAAGFISGSQISNIQFPVVSLGSSWGAGVSALNNFKVSIGNTALTTLSGTFQTGLTQVVAPANFTPVVGYNNTQTFATPFTWNGTSNIIIETTFSNNLSGASSSTVTQYNSPAGFAATIVYRNDSQSAATVAGQTTSTYNYTSRPDFRLNGTSLTQAAITWSPVTDLYTDAGATNAYAGAATTTVYSKPTVARTYTATATSTANCTSTGTATVTLTDLAAGATHTNVNCFGGLTGSITASATGGTPGYTYSIDNVTYGTTTLFSGLAAGTYTVYVKDNNGTGCTATTSVVITQPASAVTISVTNQTDPVCAGGNTGTITVAGSGGTGTLTYSINGGPSQPSGAFTGLTAGNYIVTVTDANTCTATTTTITLTNPAPITVALSSNSPVCQGGNIILTATAGGTSYSWSGPNGYTNTTTVNTVTIPAVLAADGVYSVTMTNAQNCSNTATTTVIVTPTVNVSVALATNTGVNVCSGLPVTFTATPTNGGSAPIYTFNVNGADQQTGPLATYTYNVTANDVIHVTLVSDVTCGSGPAVSADVTMNVTASVAAAVSLTSNDVDNTVCAGTSVTYTATPVSGQGTTPTYEFFVNNISVFTSGPVFTYTPVNGDDVRVVMTSSLACATGNPASSSTLTMTVNALPVTPVISAGGAITFCAGGDVTLTSTTAASYLWSNGATSQAINVSSAGNYNVVVSDGAGCQSLVSNTITVTVNPLPAVPTIGASGSTSFCTGGSVTLTSTPGTNILWSSGQSTASISVNTSGSFTVTYTDGNGCSSTSAATVVTVNDKPTVTIATPCLSILAGNSAVLTATANAGSGTISTYQWFEGANPVGTNSPTYNATIAGTYTVKVTNSNTCEETSNSLVISVGNAPLSGTYSIGAAAGCTGFETVSKAADYLNLYGVSGAVIFNVLSGHTETAPAGGIVIGGPSSVILAGPVATSATNTVTFNGNNRPITAFTPQVAGSRLDAIIKLVGADYITISGFTLQENAGNTVNTLASNTATEFGVGLFYNSSTDGAQHNTIQNNNIVLKSGYQNAIGIYSNTSHSYTDAITAADATTAAGLNSDLKVYGNTISNVQSGIIFISPVTTAALTETGVDIGGTSTLTGNTISYGLSTGGDAAWNNYLAAIAGIYYRNAVNASIRYNTVTSASIANIFSGILVSALTAPVTAGNYTNTISNNAITLTGTGTGASNIFGINFGIGSLTSNQVANLNVINVTQTNAAATSGTIAGIMANYTNVSSTFTNNSITITQTSNTGANSGIIYGINNDNTGTALPVQVITDNIITIRQNAGAGTYTGAVNYIYANFNNAMTSGNVNNNQLLTTGSTLRTTGAVTGIMQDWWYQTGFTANGNTINLNRTGNGTTYGLQGTTLGGTTAVQNVQNNSFTIAGTATAGAVNAFFSQDGFGANGTQKTFTGNTININLPASTGAMTGISTANSGGNISTNNFTVVSAGSVTGINVITTTNGAGTYNVNANSFNIASSGITPTVIGMILSSGSGHNISGNTFANMSASAAGASAPTVIGISMSSNIATLANNVFGNTIGNFSTGAGTGAAVLVGINQNGVGIHNIYQNKIAGLTTANTGAATLVSGYRLIGGTTSNFYNNLIGNLGATAVSSLDAIRGINITSTVAPSTQNISNNTIYLTAASSGTNFGTSGIYHTFVTAATTSSLVLRNNIIVNNSTPGVAGFSAALRRSAATNLNNYNTASNNNLLYAGTPSANRVIYYDGTNADQTIGAFKTRVTAARESGSVTENPTFVSVLPGDATYLHINTVTPTLIESGGTPIAGITTDFDGDTRTATPDIGADEFVGVPVPVVIINSATASPSGNLCSATLRTITANITAGGTNLNTVTLTYSFNGGAPVVQAMTGGTVTAGSTSNWTANIPAATPANAVVTWFVTATDGVVTRTLAGATYQDAPLTGITATATASAPTICEGSTVDLFATNNAAPIAFFSESFEGTFPPANWTLINAGTGNQWAQGTTPRTGANNLRYAWNTSNAANAWAITPSQTLTAGKTYTLGFWYRAENTFPEKLKVTVGNAANVAAQTTTLWDNGGADITNATYAQATVTFTPGTTGLYYFGFNALSLANQFYLHVDDVTLAEPRQFTYSWSSVPSGFSSTSQNPTGVAPTVNTVYSVTITDAASGCSVTSTPGVTVNVAALPTAPTTAPSTQCGAGVPTASASGAVNGQYRWYTVSSGGTAIAGEVNSQLGTTSIVATTTFYVSINNGTCEGPRTAVVANVSAADVITAAVDLPAVCPNSPINLTVTKAAGLNNYVYTWTATPAAGSGIPTSVTGDNINVTPTASGNYTYNVSGFDAIAGCTAVSTVNVTVNPVPLITSATATPAVICEGGSTVLTATTSVSAGAVATIGAGTVTNTTTTYPAPFGNYYWGSKHQFLIRATELSAAGLVAGPINRLAFDVTTPVTTPLEGFTISLGTTAATAITTFQTGLTPVFGPATYSPPATAGYAANTIVFSTPFTWDGTSNLVVQTCFNNPDDLSVSAIFNQSTTTYSSSVVRRVDDLTNCSGTAVNTTHNQRPNMRFTQDPVSGPGTYTWTWNPGNLSGNTVTVTPGTTTLYTVTASNGSCTSTATVNVTVNPLPTAPTANNSSQCGTQVPTASVTDVNGYTTPTFNWYAAASGGTALQSSTSATYTSPVAATTTFWVSVSNPVTLCESVRTPVTVTITAAPSITVSSNAPGNTVCAGTAVTLTASSSNTGYTYTWQAPISATGAVQSVSPAITTKYKVTASDVSGGPNAGCAITDSITINVVALPIVTITPADATICGTGPAVQLTALGTGPLLFSENFEGGGLGAFTVVNDISNETTISDWKGQASPYNTGGEWLETLNSGSSRFALANSDAVGDELFTWTNLESPTINASNYSTLALDFRHYFAYLGFFGAEGYVSVSTNGGSTWTEVADYFDTEGAPTSFANAATINLNAYAGNPNLKFRFEYLAIWDNGWAIDDVALSGTPITTSTVTWSPTAGLFTNAAGTIPYTGGVTTTVYANPATTTVYTATADNGSCTGTATTTIGKNTTMSGVYTVGAGQAGPTGFNTLTAAVKAYNTVCSLAGPVTFSLVDATYSTNETFPLTINSKASASATNTLTIKPATGVNATITGNSATSLITFNGADYITIDGSNTAGGTTRNLTINNNDNAGLAVGIWISSVASPLDGATNNTIKNTTVAGVNTVDNVGSIASMGSTYLDLADAPNSNNSIINNSLIKGQEGILILGNATSPDVNWQIRKNTFGSAIATSKLAFDGIYIGNVRDYVLDSNIVEGVSVNTTTSVVAGITLEGSHLNGTITNNKISNIRNVNTTGYGSAGIRLNASTTTSNLVVANNFISDVASTGSNNFTSLRNGNGLVIDGGGGYKIYFNTVVLNSEQTNAGSHRAAALFVGTGVTAPGSLDIRNNIFGNSQTLGTANSRYAVMSTANNNVYALMDYNDYFSTGSLLCKGSNATTYNTLALLRTNLGNNLASVNIVPVFVSPTDLHLNTDPANNIGLNGTATPIAGITTDIDADFRNTINPDMGADEFTPCSTDTYTWVGRTSTDWNEPTNWCSLLVPTNAKNVIIPQGVQRYPVLGSGVPGTGYAANFTINSSAADVTIAPAGVLEVSGNFVNNAKITIDGTVKLTGTGAQTFPGPGQIGATGNLHNFEVANTGGGVTIDNSFGITGQLLSTSGNMALGTNDVTIVSSAAATANVAPVTGTFSYGTGKFIVERFLPAKKAWRFLAAPVTGSLKVYDTWQEAGLTPAGRGVQITGPGASPVGNGLDVSTPGNSLKYYDPAQPLGFKMIDNTRTTDLANEKGYMVFVRGDRTATVASGLNNITVLRSMGQLITGTKTYNVPANGLASVGNPYASRIDLTKVYDNTGIGGASNVVASVTIWDPQVGSGVNGVGLYRTYVRNIAGDFEQTPSGTVNNFIESGQAFYVQSATGGTLTLRENDKITGSQNVSRGGNAALSRLRTNLYAPDADSGRALIDGTLIDTDPEFTNAVDNMDARKTVNTGENLGMIAGTKNLIVERRKPFVATDTVFYNMSGMKQQAYELEFVPTNLAAPGLTGYLEDNFLHTSTPVVLGSNTRVAFTVTSVTGSAAANRFRLVFKQAVILPVTITSISASRNTDRSIAVRWKVENEINIEKYTVERSADGVHFNGIITTPSTNISSYLENDLSPLSADNYYRIRALSVGGQVQYSAIVKVAPLKEASSITVYPNPAVNKTVQVQFTNEKGKYHLQLTTKLGQVLYNGTAQITGSSFVKSIELNKSVTAGTYQLKVIAEDGKVTTIQVVVE